MPTVSLDEQEQVHRDDLARAVKGTPKPKGTRIEKLRQVVARHQASRIEGKLVDAFTAQMLVKVHDALKPEDQAKFMGMPFMKMVKVGWGCIK
jgi:hypothetical protein